MSIVLTAQFADYAPRRLTLRSGQRAVVGRSPWAEFCLSEDTQLAEEHFEVACSPQPCLLATPHGVSLSLGGKPVDRLPLFNSQDQAIPFFAARTRFVARRVLSQTKLESPPVEAIEDARRLESLHRRLRQVAHEMKLAPVPEAMLLASKSEAELARQFAVQQRWSDAVRLVVRCLPLPLAIDWLRGTLLATIAMEPSVGELVDRWCACPERLQREAVVQCLASGKAPEGPWRYLLNSIQYSGGSLAPPGQPEVVPPAQLSALALATAFQLCRAADPDGDVEAAVRDGIALLESTQCVAPEGKDKACHPRLV